ncbi:Rieske 2Fe-2S domain-containing protein [Flagellatimonas centrodinii]|uniref:Rieske 2Fe-2S domain-containing protein n=1 Tax=Flagellatimonas centrodinii TaxID=2806210 RepID=UPI001FF99FF5|nr:Rieske 2Fe-2S domain-containing protein [Flagellatimonas centrodinii]ULQ47792.1 Rieske 2Fe-2S domain-containing protein [Flagellatimonas centrodinii]
MATSREYGLGEFTFPRGWFMVAESAKVTDKPMGVKYFGQEFALYRGKESGRVILLDAYCPHMGTHLARNSTSYVAQDGPVEGDSIRCPYHAWRFGPDGKCNHIPYSNGPIPPAAKVRSWPVKEHLGAVFVWHDPEGGEPDYELPVIPECSDPSWVPLAFDDLGVVESHTQEIVDNITDVAHFGPVHGSITQYFENEFKGHIAVQRMGGGHRTLTTAGGPMLETEAVYHGPSLLITKMSGTHDSYIYIAHTPVEDGSAYVWHGLMVKSPTGQPQYTAEDTEIARQYQAMALAAFAQDFEVWRHKRPCIKGLFVQGDGAFLKQRAWYKQFYNPRAMKRELLQAVEGVHRARGMDGAPPEAVKPVPVAAEEVVS